MFKRIALIAVTLAAIAAPPAVAAGDLVLTADDVTGLEPAGSGAGVARKALPRSLPRALRGARTQGAAFTGAGRRLRTGAFVAGSEARARQALRRLAEGMARLKGIGYARARGNGSSVTATVVLRAGRAVGVVRYTAPKPAGATTAAEAYATRLAARLRHALSRTAWDRAMDGIRADGSVRPGTAVKAFAIAYGTIPGAKRPAKHAGTPKDGTLAAQLVARSWDALTPQQRRAIERKLGVSRSAAAVARASQDDTPDPALQAAADKYAAFYEARMGIAAPAIDVFASSVPLDQDADGNALPIDADGNAMPIDANGGEAGPMVFCRVRISPAAQQGSAGALADTIAHEVFHCFQFTLIDWTLLPPWLLEGTATWAARVAAGTAPADGRYLYEPYLEAPGEHLFARAYDSVGFWGWAEQALGADLLWSRLPAILADGTSEHAFTVAGGTDPGFLDGWASATFRYPGAGGAWNQVRPYPVSFTEKMPPATIVGVDADLGSAAHRLRQYVVVENPSKPLVEVQRLAGHLRAGSETQDLGPVGDDWFCVGDCTCPKGQASTVPKHQPVVGPLLSLGQTGGAAAGHGRVEYHALDAFCSEPGTGVTVSGATDFSIGEPGYCVRPFPGVFQVQMPLNAGGQKVAQIVLEISGFSGAGAYPTGPSVATVYDFRKGPAHLWETPESGDITIQDPGGAAGEGAFGTVTSSTSGTSVDLGTTQVKVSGAWRCRG